MPSNLDILASVSGEQALGKLEAQLTRLQTSQYRQTNMAKIARTQNQIDIQLLDRRVALLGGKLDLTDKEINQTANLISLEKQMSFTVDERMNKAVMAHDLRRQYATEGIAITQQEAMVANEAGNKIIAIEQAKRQAMNETRKTLMAASISMFVLNISMGQLVTSIKPFVEGNEDAERTLKDVAGALQFSMAPLQAYMSLQMISTSLAVKQKVAFLGVATSLGAIFFLYQAITAQSPAMRAAYATIATVLTAVAIASWMVNFGLATGQTLMGNIAAIGIVIGGLAAMTGAIAYVSAPKAQTLTDHRKRVRSGGTAILDDDEVITRESKDGTRSGGGDTNIYLPDSYMGTLTDAKITADIVRTYTQTGQGSIQFKRKVASNG